MKVEDEVLQFHPACQFEKLQITQLQNQYLADLRGQNSIQMLTERYLKNGWLVNFELLYDLVATLALNHWILNPVVINYFAKLNFKATEFSSSKPSSRIEANYSLDLLLRLPFFRSLQIELSKYLLSQGLVQRFSPETAICKIGDSSRNLFVLLKGQAGVYTQAANFKQFISILSESSVFGEMGFLTGGKRTADVVALEVCDVLVIPYQAEILDRYLNIEKAQSLQQRFWVQHALLHSDFFKNTPPDSLDALTFAGKILDVGDQQVLFSQGDVGHSAYIVIQGSLLVVENGNTTNILPQGSFLGEISLMLNEGRRTATVIAQRNTKLLEIQRSEFYRLLAKNLYLAKEFQILAQKRIQRSVARA